MRFAVVGAGSIAGYFGGRLAAAGHDVALLTHGLTLTTIQAGGLLACGFAGSADVPRVAAAESAREFGESDFVILAVKAWQVGAIIDQLSPLLGRDTAIVTTQNGVDAPYRIAKRYGSSAVFPGTASISFRPEALGAARQMSGPGLLTYAEWNNRMTARVKRLRFALEEAGILTSVPADIWVELWSKLLFMVPFGALGAAMDEPIGVLRSKPGTRKLLAALMQEIREVAYARRVCLPEDVVETAMALADRQPENGRFSLQQDILEKRPSALNAWTGVVVRLGEEARVPTPMHDMLHELLLDRAAAAMMGERRIKTLFPPIQYG
ncbi:2-dehydropantoate 2-reductase [Micromonospora sp. NPDC047707]|uniref:2-dehydropantoate 2-reductase n=1 Tax=Micromonospora sp. NPDC047707 TaxID=3154498 RepID=UPI0034556EFF